MTSKHERCPTCGSDNCIVTNSRPHPTKRVRRRKCRVCGERWNAYESLVDPDDIPRGMMERLGA